MSQKQLNNLLIKIEVIEQELKELKIQKDQIKMSQKEIYPNLFALPNYEFFFPQSLTWIYKNLIKINDDYPEDVFPSILTESDLRYIKEMSQIELEVEAKQLENKKYLKVNIIKPEEITNRFSDTKGKLSEIHEKMNEIKRQSLIIKEIEPENLDLKRISQYSSNFFDIPDNYRNIMENANNNNRNKETSVITFEDNFETSDKVKKLLNQRSKSKKELQTQVSILESEKKSQLRFDRFFEESHKKILDIQNKIKMEFIQEFSMPSIDKKILVKLKKRVKFLFGLKEGSKFIEENLKENGIFKMENQLTYQNKQGNEFIEKKMEKMKKIKAYEKNQEINYRFNPIYNRFPDLINEKNQNSTFLCEKK